MRSLTFHVPGIAQPKGSLRAFSHRGKSVLTSDNPKLKEWERLVQRCAWVARPGEVVHGPCAVALTFALPRPGSTPKRVLHPAVKPDLDKLTRAVLDALTGVCFDDDARVCELHAQKVYAEGIQGPGVDITVRAVAPPVTALGRLEGERDEVRYGV